MKLYLASLLIFSLSACNLGCKSSDRKAEQQNKNTVIQTHEEVWSNGKLHLMDKLYAPDYIGHWATGHDTHGRDALKQQIIKSRTEMPNLTESIEQIIAEGNLVMTYFHSRGTFTGNIDGVSIQNKNVENNEVAIYRLVDGKIAEQWTIANNLLLMQQLGFKLHHD